MPAFDGKPSFAPVRPCLRLFLVVLGSVIVVGCESPNTRSGDFAVERGTPDTSRIVTVSYANVYLVETEPEPGIAVDTGFGCGDHLVPVPVRASESGLAGAIRVLLAQPDTMGLVNSLYQDDALTLDSVVVQPTTSLVFLSGRLAIGGVCDHPRISEQLQATAHAAAVTDSMAFFINGRPLSNYLSLRD